ncbi:FK506-binding protein 15-like isoform X2 [Bacillus rossius redtenbacheri]|uniref:FK506-binding protein 15-like isoform X2 n=1 Tax=Bacillus rossius redtenbacheri TaxID=93214 RepID=UPI002FDE4DC8
MLSADDEDDFSSASSSKLASLFGLSRETEKGNTTLTYTAPKQPRKEDKNAQQDQQANQSAGKSAVKPAKLNIIVVKPVHTYKLEGISYTPQGKLGAAVLGNLELRVFQLLLYKGQQQHVTSARVTSKFQFTVQPNNYGTFYDDQSQNWSIMFEGADHAVEFAREVGLARATSQSAEEQQGPCAQDLLAGAGAKVNLGDSLEIQYIARQLTGHQLGKEIDSSVASGKGMRVKVKKDVWEECLEGLCKGAKRLIVLPPNLMGMWKEQVDVHSRLALEVEVTRVKISLGSRENVHSRLPSSHDSGESAFDSSADDGSIKARGASISEALSNSPKTNKASIISRMAKMGQATLPLKGAITCNPSDSEETEEESGSGPRVPPQPAKPAAKPRSMKSRSSAAEAAPQPLALYHGAGVPWQHAQQFMYAVAPPYAAVEGQLFPMAQPVFPAPAATPPALTPPDAHMAVFLSETRAHNSEVRMGVAKVADKVDQVICKLDVFHQQQQQQQQQQQLQLQQYQHHQQQQIPQRSVTSGGLDPETLLASIQKIVTENERLHVEITEKRSKVDELNDKMYKLLQTNQKFLEQKNDNMGQSDSTQVMMVTLQQEKTRITSDLQSAESTILSLQAQVTHLQEREAFLSSEVSSLSSRLQATREEVAEKIELLQGLENQLKQSESCRWTLEESLRSSQDELLKMSQERDELAEQSVAAQRQRQSECEQAVNVAVAKYKEQIQDLEAKMVSFVSPAGKPSEEQLREEFQQKLTFQKQEMETKYSSIIQKLEEEISNLKLKKIEAKTQDVVSSRDENRSVVVEEVKKVMNMVYKQLHVRFQPQSSFQGSEVRDVLLATIRDVTLQLLAGKDPAVVVEPKTSTDRVDEPKTSCESAAGHEGISVVPGNDRRVQREPTLTVETKNIVRGSETETQNEPGNKTGSDTVTNCPEDPPTLSPEPKQELKKSGEEFFSDKDWLPQRPVPPPLFDDNEDDEDDWLS